MSKTDDDKSWRRAKLTIGSSAKEEEKYIYTHIYLEVTSKARLLLVLGSIPLSPRVHRYWLLCLFLARSLLLLLPVLFEHHFHNCILLGHLSVLVFYNLAFYIFCSDISTIFVYAPENSAVTFSLHQVLLLNFSRILTHFSSCIRILDFVPLDNVQHFHSYWSMCYVKHSPQFL